MIKLFLAALVGGVAVAASAPVNAGSTALATSAPVNVVTAKRTDCEVDFETDLYDLLPDAADLKVEEVLEIVTTYNPEPIAIAMAQEPYRRIGMVDAGDNLQILMECTNAGAHFSAKVLPGVFKVHVTRVPDFF